MSIETSKRTKHVVEIISLKTWSTRYPLSSTWLAFVIGVLVDLPISPVT